MQIKALPLVDGLLAYENIVGDQDLSFEMTV